MNVQLPHLSKLLELETRHEDLLFRLNALNKEVEKVLQQWQVIRVERSDGDLGEDGRSEVTESAGFSAVGLTFFDPNAPTF